jgi:branched-chain amino acid transport system substrate-binding protein
MRVPSLVRSARGRRGIAVLVAAVTLGLTISAGLSFAADKPGGPVTDYLSYTGGKKAQAHGSPIVIGWINAQGGNPSFPGATIAAIAAEKYINTELNGVHGHPLKLHTCYIAQAEEEGKKCGLALANDSNVNVIAYGAVVTGNQSIYATIQGKKPIVIGVSASPVDGNQKNVYILNGDQPHVLGPWGTFGRDVLKAKTAAIFFDDQAGSIPAAAATKKGLQDAGIKVTSVGFDPNLTDLLGPLTAAGVASTNMIVPMVGFQYCVATAKALAQLGAKAPVVSNPLCTFIPPPAYPGGDFPKWIIGAAQSNTAIPTLPDVKAYLTASGKYGLKATDATNVFAALAWSEVLAIAKIMNAIPANKVNAATIGAAFKAYKGSIVMGPPSINCGFDKSAVAVCNNQTRFDQYLGGGKWKSVSGWLKPPK